MVEILGVPFSTKNFEETVQLLTKAMQQGSVPHHIITANPEIVMMAQDNDTIMRLLRGADMVTPDGIGAVWASKFYGHALQDRVTGAELSAALIEFAAQHNMRVYLLGASPESNELAVRNLQAQYPTLQVQGDHGYFKPTDEPRILEQVAQFAPHLLLVGLGMPRQELFISGHKQQLGVPVSIGIGGVIDIFAGTVKRAPKFWQQMKLEWFYRLMAQPSRWRRQLVLPRFVFTVLGDRNRRKAR